MIDVANWFSKKQLTALAATAVTLFASGLSAQELAATVGTEKITLADVDKKAMSINMKAFQELHQTRQAALDELTGDMLLEKEAKRLGTTKAALEQKEIAAHIKPVTDVETQAWFDQNKARVGGRQYDEVKGQISGFLTAENARNARKEYLDKLKAKTPVRMLLDPPRIEVKISQDDPTFGPANAPITIVEYSDFECPYCSRVGPALDQVKKTYGDKIRIVWRDFPLSFHQNAHKAAQAGQCAGEQGKFWQMHDKMFENGRALGVEQLKGYAAGLGLDAKKFDTCLDSGRHAKGVDQDMAEGQAAGVTGTPAFFVNGRFVSGALPFEQFAQLIDEELALKAAKN